MICQEKFMKSILGKKAISRTLKATLLPLGLFAMISMHLGIGGLSLQTVKALSTFNSDPSDYSTLRSSNYTQFPDSTNHWASVTNANAGDIVSLAVYYHNSSQETAKNVRVSMSMPNTTGTSVAASATLSADNFNTSVGSTTVVLSSNQSLQYIPGSASWYPNQSTTATPFPSGQTGDEVVTSGGVNIGDVSSGWATQGSVVARFKVSQNLPPPPPTNATSTGSTLDITANGSQGPVTLSSGQSFTLNWVSSNVTNCTLSESDVPFSSGVTSNGSMGPVDPTHPYYPPAGASYSFVISCQGVSGPISDSVVVSQGTTPPAPKPLDAPTLFAATGKACGGTIDLTWNSISGVSSYKIFRDGTLIATSTGTSFTDTGLVPGSSHTYHLHSVSATQESADSNNVATFASNQCVNSTLDITANGSQGPVTLSSGQSFTLNWVSSNVTNCTLSESDVPFSSGVTSNGSMGPVDPTHPYYPPAGASYSFVISCQGVSGPISDSVVVINPKPVVQIPQAPKISSIDTDCKGNVTLVWGAVSGATSYKVFRNGVQIASTSATTITDSNTAPNTQYSYTVKASNSAGDSALSDPVTITTPSSCVKPPMAPTIFAVAGSSCGGNVFVSWNAVQNATSYNVYRDGTLVATSSNLSFTDSGLSQGVTYSYTVQAVNSAGTSPFSNTASTTASGVCATVPAAPTLVATTGTQCGGTISLSWNSVTNADSYKILRDGNQIATTTNTSYVDSGLTPLSSHYYKVIAVNVVGDSAYSNKVSATASAECPLAAPTVSLTANPATITKGDSSLLTWNSTNATGCNALWTTATSTSGSESVSPATTTAYAITCTNGTANATATTTVTVNPAPVPTPNVWLVANPTKISQGQNSTLSWTSTNATNCSALWTTSTNTSGSQVVSPTSTTVYTITCSNASKTATSTATVTVCPVNVPPCVAPTITSSLTATGTVGQSFSYTIVASSSATTTLSYSVATSSLPDGLIFSGNTITGTPIHSGTYTVSISATNSCGTTSKNLVITISSGGGGGGGITPTLNLTANPSTISAGATSTLSWNSTYVTSCSAPWTSATSTSGSFVVSPATTTSYAMLCTGSYGNVSATTTVTVTPVVPTAYEATIVVSKIVCSKESDLPDWAVSGHTIGSSTAATYIAMHPGCHMQQGWQFEWGPSTVTDPGGSFVGPAGNGWVTFGTSTNASGMATTTVDISKVGNKIWVREILENGYIPFTYDSTHPSNNNPESAELYCNTDARNYDNYDSITSPSKNGVYYCVAWNVLKTVPHNPSVTLTANPTSITSGSSSTLSWTSTDVTSCSAPWTTATSTSGTQSVSPSTTTPYTISCTGTYGNASSTATVTVTTGGGGGGITPTLNLTANPSTISAGATSTLSWNSTYVTSCSAPWTSATSTSGSFVVSPATTTSYAMLCTGSYGNVSATTTVTVTAVVTPNPSVTLTANPTSITSGSSSTLSWTSTDVTSCSAPWTTATSTSGTQSVSPSTTTPYTISCTGTYGNASSTATVTVTTGGGGGSSLTVNLTANPTTIAQGATSTLTWVSTGATSCAAPWTSATSTTGSFDVSPATTTTYTINCSDASNTATSSAIVTVTPTPVVIVVPPPSGGCGPLGCVPGGGGGGGGHIPVPTILGASQSCDYLHDYLHIGWANDPIEVLKLQLFLKDLEGYSNVNINGVFDQPTFDAVSQFQVQFQPDVLTPWGYQQGESTGYVYILTKKKINEIFCQKAYPLNAQQEQEINQFRTFLEGLKSNNISVPGLTTVTTAGGNSLASASASASSSTTTAGNILGISNQGNRTGSGFLSAENLSNIAAAAFAGPQGWTESLQSVVVFFLILLIIYALSQLIVSNQNKNKPEGQALTASAIRTRKAVLFVVGLVVALILCLAFHYYVIILPVLLLIIVAASTLLWFSIESKREASPVSTVATTATTASVKSGSQVKANPVQISSTTEQAKPKPPVTKTEPIVPAQPTVKTEPITPAQSTTKTEPIEQVPPIVSGDHLPEKDTVVEILNDK